VTQGGGVGRWRLVALVAGGLAALVLLGACGGGSKRATETPRPIVQTSPTAASPTPSATAAPASTATTPPASPTRAPASPTRRASPTKAASPTAIPTAALGDVHALDPAALPNYTLMMTFNGQNLPDASSGVTSANISLEIEQNSPDNYHMRLSSDDTHIEASKVDGKSYFSQGGQITEAPAGSGIELFTPSMFLQSTPELPASLGVQRLGVETLNGRQATHYRVPPENIGLFLANGDPNAAQLKNPKGTIELWVDLDLQILLKASSDASWTNADNSAGKLAYAYAIDAIGTTPVVAAPQ
jgi:hypothetical protein